jgi:arylsulfatase A-like enzyme
MKRPYHTYHKARALFVGTFCLLLSAISDAGVIHEWDPGAGYNTATSWSDQAGTNNLTSSGATAVFSPATRTSISRAYRVGTGNFYAPSASGLPTGSYTFECWVDFGSAITAGQVIFESGGGTNGIGLFTTGDGLEWCNSSSTTGSNARVAISLATLNLGDYVQIVGVIDTAANRLSLTVKDVNGVSVSDSSIPAAPIGLGSGNGLCFFGGGNGNFANILANIGGSGATGTAMITPGVFSGGIGYARISDSVDLAAPAANYNSFLLKSNRAADPRPNIIVIFTDDHGYADLGTQGHEAISQLTPNIDRLGSEGVRFTNGYVTAPQCVPSRAGLLSGRYQQRFGLDQNGKGPMELGVKTIAERLRGAGYRTGMAGKWHLEPDASCTTWLTANGYASIASVPIAVVEGFRSQAQGFEEFAQGYEQSYWKNFERSGANGSNPLGARPGTEGAIHRIDLQSQFALSFIDRNRDRPFYFHLAYYGPHVPPTPVDRYFNDANFFPTEPNDRRIALSMIRAMDDGVKDILAKLVQYGIDDNTQIWFMGDNGAPLGFHEAGNVGATDAATSWNGSLNTPLVGEKGMLAEGGIRVPFLMRWPAKISPKIYDQPVISLDVGATAVAVAGLAKDSQLDGVNLIPHLDGTNANAPHDALYWRFWDQAAMREGQWKYLKPSANSPAMLFDLTGIRGEEENVIGKHPEIALNLAAKLNTWKSGLAVPGDLGSKLNIQESSWYQRFFGLGLGYEFNTTGNNEGWNPTDITNPRVENGLWKGQTLIGSLLTQDGFLVRGASVDNLLTEVTVPENGTLTLEWAHRSDDTFSESRKLALPVSASASPQWLAFPTEDQPEWTQEMITRIRLGFSSSNAQDAQINWIRASDGDFDVDGIDDLIESGADTDGDGKPNLEDADSDGDSLPDQSEGPADPDGDFQGNFLDSDSDNDTQSDRIESLLGTSTVSPNERLTAKIAMTGSNPSVTATPGVPALNYRFSRSISLQTGSWVTLENRQPTAAGDVVFQDTPGPGETKAFYRVEAVEPKDAAPGLLAFDSFPTGGAPAEYTVGSASGQAPTTVIGFTGEWGDGDAVISTSGLTFNSFPDSGGSLNVTDATSGANANNTRSFDATYQNGTCYLSFLIQVDRTSEAFQANIRLLNNGADVARIGVHNGTIGLADNSGTVVSTPNTTNDGLTHLLVVRLDLSATGNDQMTLYLDPVPGSPEPSTALATLSGEFTFNGFRVFNNPGSTTQTILKIDELRLASTWSDAVPN